MVWGAQDGPEGPDLSSGVKFAYKVKSIPEWPRGHKQVLRAKSDIKISYYMRKFKAHFSVDLIWFGLERSV